MISVIICSINPAYLQQVQASIAATIGTPYELLVWDNRPTQEGICTVYNRMAAQARFPYLLFVHEDVSFETQHWGQKLVAGFEERPTAVLAGVAGSSYKAATYSGWFTGVAGVDCFNILHKDGSEVAQLRSAGHTPGQWFRSVAIDGVFLFCRQALWQQLPFNEAAVRGFHFYDLDFSLAATKAGEVYVVPDIDIIHYTKGGDYGERWVQEAFRFHERWNSRLPVSCGAAGKNVEQQIAAMWLDRLKNQPIRFASRLRWIFVQQLYRRPGLWYQLLKFLLYKALGLYHIHRWFK